MSNFFERVSGKAEENLKLQMTEAERRYEVIAQQLEKANAEIAELNSKLNFQADLIRKQEHQIENLQNDSHALILHRNNLAEQLDKEQKAHKFDTEKIQKELTSQIEELTAKVEELTAKNEELTSKNNALQRSVEISRPENQISDSEVPSIDYFIQKRQSTYEEYARAQEHAFKECIQQAVAENRTPEINLLDDPSFTYGDPSGVRCIFVCKQVLEKLMGDKRDEYTVSGWAPFITVRKGTSMISGTPVIKLEGLMDRNSAVVIHKNHFFRAAAVKSKYGRDNTIFGTWTDDYNRINEFKITFVLNGKYY